MEFKQTYKSRYEPTEEDLKMINYSENGYFLIVSYALIQQLGVIEAVFLQHLISKFSQFVRGGSLVSNQFFIRVEDIEHDLRISERTQRKVVQQLEQMQLIEIRYLGLPRRRHFILNSKNIIRILTKKVVSVTTNCSHCETQSLHNAVTAKRDHSNCETQSLVTAKRDILINNNINNNELSKIKPQLNSLRSFNCGCHPNETGAAFVNFGATKNANTQTKKAKTKTSKTTTFIKPSYQEVKDYFNLLITQNNLKHDVNLITEKWYSYHESNGWRVGKNPMDDWMASVRYWLASQYRTVTKENMGGMEQTCVQADKMLTELQDYFKNENNNQEHFIGS